MRFGVEQMIRVVGPRALHAIGAGDFPKMTGGIVGVAPGVAERVADSHNPRLVRTAEAGAGHYSVMAIFVGDVDRARTVRVQPEGVVASVRLSEHTTEAVIID